VLGMKAGLDPALILKVVAGGAGGSRIVPGRGPMMVKGRLLRSHDEERGVAEGHDHHRRLRARGRLSDALFAASAPIYNAAMAMGLGKEDTGAVCAVLERMAGNPRKRKKRSRR